MTTNHPERLDPALVRPGSVGVRLRTDFVQRTEARQMVEHCVARRPMDALEMGAFWQARDSRASRDVTPAELERRGAACGLAEVVALADGDGQASRWARRRRSSWPSRPLSNRVVRHSIHAACSTRPRHFTPSTRRHATRRTNRCDNCVSALNATPARCSAEGQALRVAAAAAP